MNLIEQNIFFELLRYSLWEEKMDYESWKGGWKWTPILAAIKDQTLATFMIEAILALPENLQPNATAVEKLSKQMGANLLRHGSLNKDLVEIFKLLESNGIRPVLLKGQGNATFYRKPLLRKCGDLDIYVGVEDLEKACEVLRSWKPEQSEEISDTDKHRVLKFGKTIVELHHYASILHFPHSNEGFQRISRREIGRPDVVQIADFPISIPPIQMNALFVFSHLWGHVRSCGVGLRQFCDLAAILHRKHQDINLQILEEDLKDVKMLKEWQLVGNVLVHYLGLPELEFPLYKKLDEKRVKAFVNLVLADGNFGYGVMGNMKGMGYFQRKFHVLSCEFSRGARMCGISVSMAVNNVLYRMGHGAHMILLKK